MKFSQHRLESNDPIVCATSLRWQMSSCWNSYRILERCRVKKYFLCGSFTRFPLGVSCSSFLSQKRSFYPLPLTFLPQSHCLLRALSRFTSSPHLLLCAVSFFRQSLAKCPGMAHRAVSFLGSLPEVTLHCQCQWIILLLVSLWCARMQFLRPFPQHREVRCRVEAVFFSKTFIPHWQTIEDQGVKDGLSDCFP